MSMIKIEVWDLPLRVFHWLLVSTVIAAYITGELGGLLTDWHGRIGILALGLLVFRLIWGFVGSTNARFSSFFPTLTRVSAYLKGGWQGHGHNPLGGLSVLALLGILAALVLTGLFANDDIVFEGPLFNLVSKDISDQLTGWHELIFNILAVLISLHVAAIAFYLKIKKINLVTPMVTGKKKVPLEETNTAKGAGLITFLIALALSGALTWAIASGVLVSYLQPPAPLPAASTQNW